jgi:MYXO-CTERM domain-containing protein
VRDGAGGTDTATVSVTVSLDPLGPPVAADDAASSDEDVPAVVEVLANDSGLADGPIAVTLGSAPASGTAVVGADDRITYTPAPDAHGTFTFTYVVTDADGDTAEGTVTITVAPVNDAPTGIADGATVGLGGTVSIDVLANDSDPDGDALAISAVTQGSSGGSVTLESGRIRYVPAAAFTGTDAFTYTADDGHGGTAVVTVTVTVTATDPDRDHDGLLDQFGASGGGCSSGGGGGPLTLLVIGLLLVSRRRHSASPPLGR